MVLPIKGRMRRRRYSRKTPSIFSEDSILGYLNVEEIKISNFKFFVVGELSKLLRGPKAAPKQFSPLSEAGMASLDPNAVALPQRRKRKRKNNNSLKG